MNNILIESIFLKKKNTIVQIESPKMKGQEYLAFNNLLAVKSWVRKNMQDLVRNLSKSEIQALNKYSGFKSLYINSYLRGKKLMEFSKSKEEIQEIIKNIESAILKVSTPVNLIAYRGASIKKIFGQEIKNPERLLGKGIYDKGFMSVSLLEDVAKKFSTDVVLKIKIPKGTNLAFMGAISFFEKEGEILLNKGQKLIITKITQGKKDNKYEFECELLEKQS